MPDGARSRTCEEIGEEFEQEKISMILWRKEKWELVLLTSL